jgi:hypothetical protein
MPPPSSRIGHMVSLPDSDSENLHGTWSGFRNAGHGSGWLQILEGRPFSGAILRFWLQFGRIQIRP